MWIHSWVLYYETNNRSMLMVYDYMVWIIKTRTRHILYNNSRFPPLILNILSLARSVLLYSSTTEVQHWYPENIYKNIKFYILMHGILFSQTTTHLLYYSLSQLVYSFPKPLSTGIIAYLLLNTTEGNIYIAVLLDFSLVAHV